RRTLGTSRGIDRDPQAVVHPGAEALRIVDDDLRLAEGVGYLAFRGHRGGRDLPGIQAAHRADVRDQDVLASIEQAIAVDVLAGAGCVYLLRPARPAAAGGPLSGPEA